MSLYKYFKFIILSLLFLTCSIQSSQAQDYKSSIGIRLGTYISATYSSYISEGRSIEALAGITRVANQSDYILGGFYKIQMHVSSQVPTLKWYFGGGLYLSFESEIKNTVAFSPSSILGMEYTLEHTPVNFFVDLSPHYKLNSNLDKGFNVHANLGVRYVLSSYN